MRFESSLELLTRRRTVDASYLGCECSTAPIEFHVLIQHRIENHGLVQYSIEIRIHGLVQYSIKNHSTLVQYSIKILHHGLKQHSKKIHGLVQCSIRIDGLGQYCTYECNDCKISNMTEHDDVMLV